MRSSFRSEHANRFASDCNDFLFALHVQRLRDASHWERLHRSRTGTHVVGLRYRIGTWKKNSLSTFNTARPARTLRYYLAPVEIRNDHVHALDESRRTPARTSGRDETAASKAAPPIKTRRPPGGRWRNRGKAANRRRARQPRAKVANSLRESHSDRRAFQRSHWPTSRAFHAGFANSPPRQKPFELIDERIAWIYEKKERGRISNKLSFIRKKFKKKLQLIVKFFKFKK